MKGNKKSNSNKLNREEKDILSSFEKGEWKSIENVEKAKVNASINAKTLCRKDAEKAKIGQ